MLFWDKAIDLSAVSSRLRKLPFPRVAMYVVGCVTHAKGTILSASCGKTELVGKVDVLLTRFWNHFPKSLQSHFVESLVDEVGELLPGEEGGPSGWEDALVWAAAYAFSLVKRQQYSGEGEGEGIAALDRAYWAVFAFHHEQDRT